MGCEYPHQHGAPRRPPMSGPRPSTRPARGTELNTLGWQQGALRMLMNNLDAEVAEHPTSSSSTAAPARRPASWEAFDAIVRTLKTLSRTRPSSSSVRASRSACCAPASGRRACCLANSNLVGDWANWEEFRKLEAEGLHHVRPDDGRFVDLHRLAGHRPGHLRDLRRGRPQEVHTARWPAPSPSPPASAAWMAPSPSRSP
ncbi:hypothetical protein [Streptomyces sp. KL116D]|uniref:hypothetical protein n=1 Tax=Streptomyces sp. KL116D TaxID=3045152 RepID=UPI003557BB3C